MTAEKNWSLGKSVCRKVVCLINNAKYFLVLLACGFLLSPLDPAQAQEAKDGSYGISDRIKKDQLRRQRNIDSQPAAQTEQKTEEVENDEAVEDAVEKTVESNVEESKDGLDEMIEDVDTEIETEPADKEENEEDYEGDPEEGSEARSTVSAGVNMDQLITLDLRGMDVSDAMTYIALRSGANIVSSKLVTGRVTLQLKDVPLQDVFDITLLTNSLAYEKIGDIFYVMTEQEYEARYGKKFSDIRQVKMIQLRYAIPEKAFDLLDTLKSSIGRILVDQNSGAVLMVDTKEKIEEMESALLTLEQKGDTRVVNLQYAIAEDVEAQLRGQLDDINVGSIWSDERNNQVIVKALPDRMGDIMEVIKALDQKTREVLIDTKIIKIQVSDTIATGFE